MPVRGRKTRNIIPPVGSWRNFRPLNQLIFLHILTLRLGRHQSQESSSYGGVWSYPS
nr:MAG TPA_asm: hypothetical protein [Caudoviricetes sp.]